MMEVSRRNVHMPLRHGMPLPNGNGRLGMMYGYLGAPESFGIKLVSLFPKNASTGLSSHLGLVVLYEADNGRPVAIMDGAVITAIRTAAASAVATEHLSRSDAHTLAILGNGEQAETHLRAIPEVREITKIRIWGRNKARADEFAAQQGSAVKADVNVVGSVEEAVEGADIVCTVTAAPEPILFGRSIEEGMHINLVGSSFPDMAEVDTELVVRSRYFVDYRESTLAQAGEFLRAKEDGAVDDTHIVAEIGEVLMGEARGRESDEDITVYKSLGVIAQDLSAATYVWHQAESRGLGTVAEI
jgi:ornithine cyclodeaminase